jgi:hypothetical protein
MDERTPQSGINNSLKHFKNFRKTIKIFSVIVLILFLYDCSLAGNRYSISFATGLYDFFLQPTITCLKAIRKHDNQSVDYVISTKESTILADEGGDAYHEAKYTATEQAKKLFCNGINE